jgi:hypothetical protein
MRDTLKDYIDQHRGELDKAVPSDKLWAKIETSMIVAIPAAGITSGIPWLKYFGFGLSSVAGAAVVYTVATSSSAEPAVLPDSPSSVKTVTIENSSSIMTSNPVAEEFILMNTASPLPPQNNSPIADVIPPMTPTDTAVSLQAPAPLKTSSNALSDSSFIGIKRVEVIATSIKVTVNGSNDNQVNIIRGDEKDTAVQLIYTRIDTLLRITAKVQCGKPVIKRSRGSFVSNNCNTASGIVNLNIPSGTSIVIQNTYGNSVVSGVSAPVCEVRTSSGDVTLASIKAAVKVVTSYGDLNASSITGDLTARLSSGSATVSNVTGNVDVVSTYGDQQLSDITGNLKANGSSGNIRISNLNGDVNANTTYGDISINNFKGSARLISSSGSINGEKVELTANSTFVTTYGDVKMNLINPLEALSFELATTYGEISIDKNGEKFTNDSRLNLKRGNILIKATSSSGDQTFR